MLPKTTDSMIKATMARIANEALERMAQAWGEGLPGAHDFQQLEENLHDLGREMADQLTEIWLKMLLKRSDYEQIIINQRIEGDPRPIHRNGSRGIKLTLKGGREIELELRQIRYKRLPSAGRPRRQGKRRKGRGHFSMPQLQALGFVQRLSPALAYLIAECTTACESFAAARQMLEHCGVKLDGHKHWRRFRHVAIFLAAAHTRWLKEADGGADSPVVDLSVEGARVAVAFDGGRSRERIPKRGRRKANGHHGFKGPWVEPRQVVIYRLDERGKRDRRYRAVSLGMLDSGDICIKTLGKLLKALDIEQAEQVVLLGDGARWQWPKLRDAVISAGVDPSRIREILDLPHAMGALHRVAKIPKNWSESERRSWLKQARQMLKAGEIKLLEQHIKPLAVGGRAKDIKSALGFFQHHRDRMDYAAARRDALPLGSGVVESMIRQVINMRIKGCGRFWKRDNLRRMLLLRSWLKAGRLADLFRFALRQRTSAWLDLQINTPANDDALDSTPLAA